ncbi:pilus assembly FimT family protein [Congregicoccus parvus]|uniref:pilus assembly FimT family protein n=1 Tax=Congregicoccus parvus TaxID=3081749 RepID=UPI003FA58513
MVDVNVRHRAKQSARFARRERGAPCVARRRTAGFSLIELLAVIAIIAVMSGLVGYLLRGSGTESRGLQTAQSTVASLLTLARSQAAVSGRSAVFLVNNNEANSDRYLRYLVVATLNPDSGIWEPVNEGVTLPHGCYVRRHSSAGNPANEIETGADWSSVFSTALSFSVSQAINGDPASPETWMGIRFSPRGTTIQAGNNPDVVLATGRVNPPGAAKPFTWTNPDNVRGVSVSIYGQLTMLNNRKDL